MGADSVTLTPRLQLEDTILATRDMLIARGVELPFELKRRDPKEPGRRRKEKAEDKTYKVTMRHFRKQKKALRDNLEWHYPQRMKVVGTTDLIDLLSDDDYDAQLQAMLTQAAQDGVLLFEETGVGFPSIDYTLVNTQAAKWASKYSGSLIKGIDKTTLDSVRGAISSFVETPGMTIGDVMRGLGPTFSEDRALMIATTEITKAYAEADKLAGVAMQKEFPDMEAVKTWWTNNDDLVCVICGPNHNVTVKIDENFPSGNDGPPAHPRCRCWRSTTTRFAEAVEEVLPPREREYRAIGEKEALAELDPYYRDWIESLPETQQWAIECYANGDYSEVNRLLREGYNLAEMRDFDEDLGDIAKWLGEAIDNAPGLPEDLVFHRGFESEDLWNMVNNGDIDIGDVIEESQFLSTSADQGMASEFGKGDNQIIYKIHTPEGSQVAYINDLAQYKEAEAIFRPGSQFELLGINSTPEAQILDLLFAG